MSFSTETTRLCRYHGCWRDIVTDAPSPLIGHGVEPNLNLLCDKHASQLTGDLRWLDRSLPDLCEYRINRAYGHKNGGGGQSGTAPAPLREALHDLLYADDDHGYPGLQGTLYEWMRSLKINLPESTPLSDMVHRIANHPKCGFSMPVALIRAERVKRLLQSEAVRTRDELLDIIKACGMRVNRSTLRSWIHRGQLPQQGEDAYSNPLYRFSDFYRLASGLSEDADVWEIMQVSQNQSKEGDDK